jgi:hypothetical protein
LSFDGGVMGAIQFFPQHFLNFLPLPQAHGSLRPTLGGAT